MTKSSGHTPLSKSIFKTLLYFDIFQYPLTAAEIFKHLPTNHVSPDQVSIELTRLSNQSILYSISDFFSVQNNQALGSRRIKGNQLALQHLTLVKKKSLFISKFPFVRAVMASGSLSKDYMDEHSDLDFFVITQPNRLWIARMILVLYKKIFLFNSHKYFCINYYLDENHLEIEEKNIFTATELATLIPLYGKEYYHQLMIANEWLKNYLPNHAPRSTHSVATHHSSWIKRRIEGMFNLVGVTKLEQPLMNLISLRWKRQYQSLLSKNDFEVAFKTKEYVSKGHPNNHQRKVLNLYQQKLEDFGKKLNINWDE
ncbi:MAG: hypothetical protein ACKVOQ_20295 [Cyclobacteriaceae bacterium]